MTATKTYTARAVRSGNWWAIDVEGLPGVFSQARRLDQVEAMAGDAIASSLDIAPDSFDIKVVRVLPERIRAILEDLVETQFHAALCTRVASKKAQHVARLLHDEEHMPLRDVGSVLGVSPQRANQLVS